VLDSRGSIYSAITGLHLTAPTPEARTRFRFCCALNPQLSDAGRGVLPEYIEERTLPAIPIDYLPFSELNDILKDNLPVSGTDMDDFEGWYNRESDRRLSVRQALTIVRYASSLQSARGNLTMNDALNEVEPMVLRPEERGSRTADSSRTNGSGTNDGNGDEDEDEDEDTELEE
jgi:hypothetical protein